MKISDFAMLSVSALTVAFLVATFPTGALHTVTASSPAASAAMCAFVTLSEQEERDAVVAARTTWQLNRETARMNRVKVFEDTLPAEKYRPVLDGGEGTAVDVSRVAAHYEPELLPGTLAAPSPIAIADDSLPEKRVAFPREMMLEIGHGKR